MSCRAGSVRHVVPCGWNGTRPSGAAQVVPRDLGGASVSPTRATAPGTQGRCAGAHEVDGYLAHGHVVQGAVDLTPHGHTIEYWQTVHRYKERVEPVEVHLGGDSIFKKFDEPEYLRVYAEDMLDVADKLDKMNGYTQQ
jgi:hypothetical protein